MKTENRVLRFFLTGSPGAGKTTLMRRLHEHYAAKGVMVSGIITEEARSEGTRSGFRIRNLMSGEEGWLASKTAGTGPKIGSYTVITPDLERVGARTLQNAARGDGPLVLIDEVGPMEMTSPAFRRALSEVLSVEKVVVATVKQGSHYEEVEKASKLHETRSFEVSTHNRDHLLPQLTALIDPSLGLQGG